MRLNLGCGDLRLPGYLNVDLREDVGADIVGDGTDLKPLNDESVEEIMALDFLEHFPADRTQKILAEWRRVLKPGGTLTVKVPNLLHIADLIVRLDPAADPRNDQATLRLIENVYGGHRWGPDGAWDTHHTGWTPRMIAAELERAGFTVIGNDGQINMTISAVKDDRPLLP